MTEASRTESNRRGMVSRAILLSLAIYVVWVIATYILEGRVNLLLRVDPIGRVLYITIANIVIGTIIAFWALRYMVSSGFITQRQIGFNKSVGRTAAVVVASTIGGLAIFLLQNPASTDPIVVFNAYMQVLPVSIAEVIVCWVVIGTNFESLTKSKTKSKAIPVIVGAVVASVLFGIYHYAHSPPFNETSMVLFLMIPAIAPSIVYFIGRDIFGAIIIQNFLGIYGVMRTINLAEYSQPRIEMYILTIPAIAALVVASYVVSKRTPKVDTETGTRPRQL